MPLDPHTPPKLGIGCTVVQNLHVPCLVGKGLV
jgi:hypothetical protein